MPPSLGLCLSLTLPMTHISCVMLNIDWTPLVEFQGRPCWLAPWVATSLPSRLWWAQAFAIATPAGRLPSHVTSDVVADAATAADGWMYKPCWWCGRFAVEILVIITVAFSAVAVFHSNVSRTSTDCATNTVRTSDIAFLCRCFKPDSQKAAISSIVSRSK